MKGLAAKIFFGKSPLFGGILALLIVGVVGIGCNIGKDDYDQTPKGGANSNSAPPETTLAEYESNSAGAVDSGEPAPSEEVVIRLARQTTSEFGNAVNSGDFSQIHAGASEDFQKTYTVEQMTEAFKSYTDQKAVVAPILEKVDSADVELTRPPFIRNEKGLKILVTSGKFATSPHTVRFDYEYVNRNDQWKLLKLVVNIP